MEVLKSRTCCGWPIQIGVSVIALVEIVSKVLLGIPKFFYFLLLVQNSFELRLYIFQTKLIVTLAGLGWINLVEPMITSK